MILKNMGIFYFSSLIVFLFFLNVSGNWEVIHVNGDRDKGSSRMPSALFFKKGEIRRNKVEEVIDNSKTIIVHSVPDELAQNAQ